jgi:DNA gyrase subunit A
MTDEASVAPDARDGLTAKSRRVLMWLHDGCMQTSGFVTSARIVRTAAAAHELGDGVREYDELVRLTQEFRMRHPLVEGQGNFGSIDDDPAASMAYTEVRLHAVGAELLRGVGDIARGHELQVLPARFPNLLVNGWPGGTGADEAGIAPHNLREVVNAVVAYIDNPQIGLDELLRHLPGPDFPTGAVVLDRPGIRHAYETGRGRVHTRARSHVERVALLPGTEREAIVVTELPYGVMKGGENGVISEIAISVAERRLGGIVDIMDSSDAQHGLRIVITLDAHADPAAVLDALYAQTQLQTVRQLHTLALVAGTPRTLDLREAIARYVDHQRELMRHTTADRIDDAIKLDLREVAARLGDDRRSEIR